MDKYRFIYRFVDEYLSCFQFSATTNMAVIEFWYMIKLRNCWTAFQSVCKILYVQQWYMRASIALCPCQDKDNILVNIRQSDKYAVVSQI